MDSIRNDATRILSDLSAGDAAAADRLLPLVYDELKRIASGLFQDQPDGHSLQPTALVHEAYLKLIGTDGDGYSNRAHFLAVAAMAMRQILIDHARTKRRAKRGGDGHRVTLDLSALPAEDNDVDMLALHDALERLASFDARKAKVIELRFFGGLDIAQAAEVLDVARSTVTEDWRFARAWIVRELRGDGEAS